MNDTDSGATAPDPTARAHRSTRPSLARVFRLLQKKPGLLSDQMALNGKLAWTEWLLERDRLARLAAAAAACLAFLLMADALACLLLAAASWGTPFRLPVLAVLALIHLAGAGLAWRRCQALATLGNEAFAACREEFARDAALFAKPA